MHKLLAEYDIDIENPQQKSKQEFKTHVEKKAIEYLKNYWEMPPRHLAGAVHSRYKTAFGIGELTTTRPKMRKYLRDMTANTYYHSCKAAELLMHFRLECLPLNAFHRHVRRNESASACRLRELCPCCQEAVETPTHFLLDCPAYSSSRSLPHIAECIADVASLPDSERWCALLDCPTMATFIYDAWNIRRAALTGRGANGGHSMALPPVPEANINGEPATAAV
jgi:hypothetical protein